MNALLSSASDYRLALRASTEGKLHRVPVGLWLLARSKIRYKLGPRPYSLFRLWQKDSASWGDYLDDSPLKPVMRSLSKSQDRKVVTDKIRFHQACIELNLPTVPILGVFGPLDDDRAAGLARVKTAGDLHAILDAQPAGVFCKPYNGTHGIGTFAITRHASGSYSPLGTADLQELFAYCARCAGEGRLLVQPRLVNAAPLRHLMAEGGFGTVRAVTYMEEGEPKFVAACLRIIVEGNAADNFGHGSSGNFVASIEPSSGRLIALRASRSRNWPFIYDATNHPLNGYPVAGFQIPHWEQCVQLILKGQKAFPKLHSIGWDIGITEEGPLLIEGNAQYDFDLLQVAFDRGFKPELEKIRAAYRDGSAT
jgi:hypothetical protein